LGIRAVIIDHQGPLGRRIHEFEPGSINDLLQADDVCIQCLNDLAELTKTIPLIDHLGAKKFDVVGRDTHPGTPQRRGDTEQRHEPTQVGCNVPPVPSHQTSPPLPSL
jgi:hypothetical protein